MEEVGVFKASCCEPVDDCCGELSALVASRGGVGGLFSSLLEDSLPTFVFWDSDDCAGAVGDTM